MTLDRFKASSCSYHLLETCHTCLFISATYPSLIGHHLLCHHRKNYFLVHVHIHYPRCFLEKLLCQVLFYLNSLGKPITCQKLLASTYFNAKESYVCYAQYQPILLVDPTIMSPLKCLISLLCVQHVACIFRQLMRVKPSSLLVISCCYVDLCVPIMSIFPKRQPCSSLYYSYVHDLHPSHDIALMCMYQQSSSACLTCVQSPLCCVLCMTQLMLPSSLLSHARVLCKKTFYDIS